MQHDHLLSALAERGRLGAPQPQWAPHPRFSGVRLMKLVDSADSGGALTTLLVALEAGAMMPLHRHDAETEQHIVLEGEGVLTLGDTRHDYRPGQLAIIPRGTEHAVVAGPAGMVLLAVFSPGS